MTIEFNGEKFEHARPASASKPRPLLLVSPKVRVEALPIFFQINAFTATCDIKVHAGTVRERKFTLQLILLRDLIRGISEALFRNLQLELTSRSSELRTIIGPYVSRY